MADLARIKSNVARMVSQNAPEADIDEYIKAEGVTIDDVKNFNVAQPSARSQAPFLLKQLGTATLNTPTTVNTLLRGAAKPFVQAIGSAGLGIEGMVTGNKPMGGYDVPFPGGSIPVRPMQTLPQSVGLGAQGAAYALPGTSVVKNMVAGGLFGGGEALAEQKSPLDVGIQTAIGIGTGVIPSVPKGTSAIYNKVKNALNAGKSLNAVKREIAQQPSQQLALQRAIKDAKALKGATIGEMELNFNNKNKLLRDELNKESLLRSGANKDKIKELAKDMSTTYRNGLNQAEDALAKKGTVVTPVDYEKVIDNTLDELKLKGMPIDNPAYAKLIGAKAELESQYPTNQLTLSDLKNFKNKVYDTISSDVKSGNKWADADDQVAMIYLKNHGSYLETLSPELKQLNAEFAPMANARAWASKTFKPFNKMEIQRGANVLEKLATKEYPNKTDLNYIKQLEEGSGRFGGAGNLRGKTTKLGKSIRVNKQSFDKAKKELLDAINYKIYQLENKIAQLKERKINLGFQQKELEELKSLRNKIIWIGVAAATAGAIPTTRKAIGTVIGQ